MNISDADDITALRAVSDLSGHQRDWADVMPALRQSLAPEQVGMWRQSAKARGFIERHPALMNVARITQLGQESLELT